jgi:hypothetical protein
VIAVSEDWLRALEAIHKKDCRVQIDNTMIESDGMPLDSAVAYAEAVCEHMTDRESHWYTAVVVAGGVVVWPLDRAGVTVAVRR